MSEKRVVKTTEKVVSTTKKAIPNKNLPKQIIKNNPISRRVRKIGGAVKAIPFGIVLLLVGLYLTYAAVINVKEISKIVNNLNTVSAKDVSKEHDLAFFEGKPELITDNSFEYKVCERSYECTENYEYTTKNIDDVFYISIEYQRYEQKEEKREETRTRIENGEEIEETVEITELVEDWETKQAIENWYDFKVGGITVRNPSKADRYINTDTQTIERVYVSNLSATPYINASEASDKVGSTRMLLTTYTPSGDINVVGAVKNGQIDTEDIFIITEQSKDSLVQTLERKEKTSRNMLRFFAWLTLTIGFMTVLGPILSVLEMIPFAGKVANTIALFIGAIVSAIIVVIGGLLIKFWWLFLIIVLLLIAGAGYLFLQWLGSKKQTETTNEEKEEDKI